MRNSKYLSCRPFQSLRLPWKTEFALKFFTVLNVSFTIQDLWATSRLPWKTEFALKIFTLLNIFFAIQDCWTTLRLPWSRCIKYTFCIQDCWATLALKNRAFPEIFHSIGIFFSFRIFEQLALALKNRVWPEFAVLKYTFYIQDCWATLALKNRAFLEIFHSIGIFFSFRIFEQLALALKTQFVLKFFKSRGAAASPSHTPMLKTEFFSKTWCQQLNSDSLIYFLPWQFISRYDTHTAQNPGSLFWWHAVVSLQFTNVCSFSCMGRLPNLRADCFIVGLYCVTNNNMATNLIFT